MSNSILGNSNHPNNINNNMLQQFNQFRQSFQGDPKQQVLQLMAQGKMSNEQFQQAVQIAQKFKNFVK